MTVYCITDLNFNDSKAWKTRNSNHNRIHNASGLRGPLSHELHNGDSTDVYVRLCSYWSLEMDISNSFDWFFRSFIR